MGTNVTLSRHCILIFEFRCDTGRLYKGRSTVENSNYHILHSYRRRTAVLFKDHVI